MEIIAICLPSGEIVASIMILFGRCDVGDEAALGPVGPVARERALPSLSFQRMIPAALSSFLRRERQDRLAVRRPVDDAAGRDVRLDMQFASMPSRVILPKHRSASPAVARVKAITFVSAIGAQARLESSLARGRERHGVRVVLVMSLSMIRPSAA